LSVLAIFVAHPRVTTTWTPTRSACEPPVLYVGCLFRTWAGLPSRAAHHLLAQCAPISLRLQEGHPKAHEA